jgi:large subunit ribosomal protein L25
MTYSVVAVTRTDKGEKVRKLGQIPAVVYGKGADAESVSLEYAHFTKLYRTAGEASLIDLMLDGQNKGKVLIQDVQFDPVKGRVIHVDLRRIDMNKAMTATIELRFIGESPIIKAAGGTLVTNISSASVECLPKDLVSHIDIDLSVLTTYDDAIKVKDLKLPEGIKIAELDPEALIVKAQAAITEEEIKAMEEAATTPVDLTAIETEKKGKEEDAEAAPEGAQKEEKADKKE